jgi:TATA-box binding protein (TBP) (component of TFIID and TFIIIB)
VIEANMFLFSTGKIKIAGTTRREHTDRSLDTLITSIEKSFVGISYMLNSIESIMINSDFCVDFELECYKLYQLLRNEYIVSYEPNTHPAVIIKFMINENYEDNVGICFCSSQCCGKSKEMGECKTVSVLIFSSGKIILTGARDMQHIHIAYERINQILNQNRETIEIV